MAEAITGDRCLADEVAAFRGEFQEMRYCFEPEALGTRIEDVLGTLF